MRRLDILVLGLNYSPEHTGISPYTSGMAHALDAAGHAVHVVTGFPHYPQWRIADGYEGNRMEERDGGVRVTRVRHPVPRRPTGPGRIVMEAAFAAATLRVRHHRPDVVIVVSPALLTVAAGLLRRWSAGGKRPALGVVTQDLYGSVVEEAGVLGGRGSGLIADLERSLLSRADGVVAVHEAFRPRLASYGVADEAITVIHNWTHTRPATGDPAQMRRRLGWAQDRTIALHAGNMGAKQGLENVVAAARRAELHGLPLEFVLLGDGNQRRDLERFGADCANLRFQDPLPDGEFETALAAADVLVLNERSTVRQMCAPSKLTSYFAAGRPVVAATCETGPAGLEVIASGAGVVVEPDRPDLLADAALRLGGDAGTGLGDRGRRFAAMSCSADAAHAAYVDWVARLAGEPAPVATSAAGTPTTARKPRPVS